jgi:hypothetical protein
VTLTFALWEILALETLVGAFLTKSSLYSSINAQKTVSS